MIEAVLLSKPEISTSEEPPGDHKLKRFMIAEGLLIGSNIKVFVTSMTILTIGIAEMASEQGSVESYTFKGALLVAILFLVRVIAQKDKKIEELYDRLSDKEETGNGDNGHPRRHDRK